MKKDEKLILWTERLQAFQASGQTCREWCREHQIPVSTMTYWNRRLRTLESESQPELVFAKMPTEQELSCFQYITQYITISSTTTSPASAPAAVFMMFFGKLQNVLPQTVLLHSHSLPDLFYSSLHD